MPTITLKNVPPSLHRKLKDQATHNFRSLNSEILACLTRGVWVTDDDIRQARDEGRP
jgi:plasmid stability protein